MMKKYTFILILLIISLFLTGCWNYREIDKLSFLAGVAVDRDRSTGQYELTAEIIDAQPSGNETQFNSLLLTSKAPSIHDASRKMISLSSKQLYWGHATSIILSENIGKEGMAHVIDWAIRDYESRLNIYVFITQAERAQDILQLEPVATEIRSFELSTIVESSRKISTIPRLELYELVNLMSKKGIVPVVPTVKETYSQGKKTMEVSGGAIIKDKKIQGYLSEDEIKHYLLAVDRFDAGIIIVDLKDKANKATVEILRSKSSIKPKFEDNTLKMEINIKAKGQISATEYELNITDDKGIVKIKKNLEDQLKKDILNLISKSQKVYNADIFGFGKTVKGRMPKLWKSIEDNWYSIYKDLQVDINIDASIEGSGHFSKTLNIKE